MWLKSKVVQKIGLVIVGAIVGLLLLEMVMRVVAPIKMREWVRRIKGELQIVCTMADEKLDHRLKPNCQGRIKSKDFEFEVVSNSLGLREREVGLKKEKGRYRVLILGDSFAMGWGVKQEDRFSEVAVKKLREQGEEKVEIINAGINSYSPVIELEYLRDKGIQFDPDLVMVLLDLSDLYDDYFYGGWQRHDQLRQVIMLGSEEAIEVEEQIRRKDGWWNWLVNKSRLVYFGYTRLAGMGLSLKQRLGWENLVSNILIYERAIDWQGYEKAWNLPMANLRLMKEYLEGEEIEMVVILVPRGIFFEGEWQGGRKLAGFKPGAYDRKTVAMIEKKLRELEIKTVDWHETFWAANRTEELFYDNDGHWTVKGNQAAGEELARFLQGAVKGKL